MHERYGCDGKQQENRTMYYFEYPASVTMLLREIRYGVELRMTDVTINPFGPSEFEYHIGNIDISFSKSRVTIATPGSGMKTYKLSGLAPSTLFHITASEGCESQSETWRSMKKKSSSTGYLEFAAPVGGSACIISVVA